MSAPAKQGAATIRHGPRWIAVATICVTVVATITTPGAFLMAIPLILGLIADALGARRGRWLMWMGAAFLSVTILQMELEIFPEFVSGLFVSFTSREAWARFASTLDRYPPC